MVAAETNSKKALLWPAAAVLFTFIVLFPTLQNGWVNWDDYKLVRDNVILWEMSAENLAQIFGSLEVNGSFHPITLLSWLIDHNAERDPFPFHFTNLCLHLINVLLVFRLAKHLTGRASAAFIAALFFGIHPMHLEAVAWITARKDLLYTLFYLGGMLWWLRYIRGVGSKSRTYAITLLFFVLSLFSKGMAVTFPLALLALDYLEKRPRFGKLLVEKLPFIFLAGIFSYIAYAGQDAGGAVATIDSGGFVDQFFVACYGFSIYLMKLVAPLDLAAYHPYPFGGETPMPTYFYFMIVPVLAYGVAIWRWWKTQRLLVFGLLLFGLALIPVIQLIPVGSAITSERFTYLAYLGPFLLAGWLVSKVWTHPSAESKKYKGVGLGLLAVFSLFFAVLTWQHAPTWQNGETLWTKVIEEYPDEYYAFASRAQYRAQSGQGDRAMTDYTKSLAINPVQPDAWNNRGRLYLEKGDQGSAMSDFAAALKHDPEHYQAMINVALIHRINERYNEAMVLVDKVILIAPEFPGGYSEKGRVLEAMGLTEDAFNAYDQAVSYGPADARNYFNRGYAYCVLGDLASGLQDFIKAGEVNPGYGSAFLEQAKVLAALGRMDEARQAGAKAKALNVPVPADLLPPG